MNHHPEPNAPVYRSKRDLWLMALLAVFGIGVATGAIATLLASGSFLDRSLTALFQFLRDLAARTPDLRLDGDRLVPD